MTIDRLARRSAWSAALVILLLSGGLAAQQGLTLASLQTDDSVWLSNGVPAAATTARRSPAVPPPKATRAPVRTTRAVPAVRRAQPVPVRSIRTNPGPASVPKPAAVRRPIRRSLSVLLTMNDAVLPAEGGTGTGIDPRRASRRQVASLRHDLASYQPHMRDIGEEPLFDAVPLPARQPVSDFETLFAPAPSIPAARGPIGGGVHAPGSQPFAAGASADDGDLPEEDPPIERRGRGPDRRQALWVQVVDHSRDVEASQVTARDRLNGGDLGGALRIQQSVARLRPNDVDVLFELARTRQLTGDAGGAIDAYTQILHQNPRHLGAAVSLLGLIAVDQPMVALQRMIVLARQYPDMPSLIGQIGLTNARLGRIDDGLRNLVRAGQLAPTEAIYPYNAAVLLDQLGRRQDAIALYRKALAIDAQGLAGQPIPRIAIESRLDYLRRG